MREGSTLAAAAIFTGDFLPTACRNRCVSFRTFTRWCFIANLQNNICKLTIWMSIHFQCKQFPQSSRAKSAIFAYQIRMRK